ncbi:MAG TPA: DUF5661 family protein [Candidatus Binatia bacterium]|jgi:hypothetical protein|nr:DUF5661 family protein [Candidatus Binatia bacterium]
MMKKNIFPQIVPIVIMGFALVLFVESDRAWAQTAQPQIRQSVERKFEEYRTAIKDAHQIDIKNFKEKLTGGMADGKPITNYDIGQLLEGIKWETKDHTNDRMLALELAMDHLESIPDYYTRLARMDWECRSEKIREM